MDRKLKTLSEAYLNKLYEELQTVPSDEQQKIFLCLSLYIDPKSIELVYVTLIQKGTQQSIYWLVKYLININNRYSFDKLIILLKETTPLIREISRSAIDNAPPDLLYEISIEMLGFLQEKDICLALKNLGSLSFSKSVLPILISLEKHKKNNSIAKEAIVALGSIEDTRSFNRVLSFLNHDDIELQKVAIESLCKLSRLLPRSMIYKSININNIKVKESAYLSLIKESKWEKYFIKYFSREIDPQLRFNVLSSISTFKTKRFFKFLLTASIYYNNRLFRIVALSLLENNFSESMTKTILKALPQIKGNLVSKYIFILTKHSNPVKIFNLLKEQIQNKTETLQFDLAIIENTRHLYHANNISAILEEVKSAQNNTIKYAWGNSLCYMLNSIEEATLQDLFNLNDPLIAQLLMNKFINTHTNVNMSDDTSKNILKFIKSDNKNLKTQSILCLEKIKQINPIEEITKILKTDRCQKTLNTCYKTIVKLISEDNDKLIDLMDCLKDDIDFLLTTLTFIIDQIDFSHKAFLHTFRIAFEHLKNTPENKKSLEVIRILVNRLPEYILDVIQQDECEDNELYIILKYINKSRKYISLDYDLRFIIKIYPRISPKTEKEILYFCKSLTSPPKYLVDFIISKLGNKSSTILGDTEKTVKFFIKQSAEGILYYD